MFLTCNSLIVVSFIYIIIFIYFPLPSLTSLSYSWDLISGSLVILSLFRIGIVLIIKVNYTKELIFLVICLILTFSTKNFFNYFILLEGSIVPILCLILIKGYQPERIEASMSLVIYTYFGGLPLLVVLIILNLSINSLSFILIIVRSWDLGILMILSFFIKLPIWPFHSWLPKAHVESPVGGSIVLAAILLKLGSYGIWRCVNMIWPIGKTILFVFCAISIVGIINSIFYCLRTVDMKVWIAYSSVFHIRATLVIMRNFNFFRFYAILVLSLAHGFSSALIFFVSSVVYKIKKTRRIVLNKGFLFSPFIALMIRTGVLANIGFPPIGRFWRELLVLIRIIKLSWLTLPAILIVVLISGVYNIGFLILFLGNKEEVRFEVLSIVEILIHFIFIFIIRRILFWF